MKSRRLSYFVLGRRSGAEVMARLWLGAVAASLFCSPSLLAQNLLQNLGRSDGVASPSTINTGSLPYTFKSGDFRLLLAPSMEMDWNDNINGASSGAQQDFILQPTLNVTGTYPVTEHNLLSLNLGIGYAEYVEHPIYNGLRINGGSQLSFDVFVGDFRFNFHDSASDSQDTGAQGAVAGTAFYGGLNNSLGVTAAWSLGDVVLTLGYDHDNYFASSSEFSYLNYSSENPLAQASLRIRSNLSVGVESSATFVNYSDEVLNNSQSYSAGVFSTWNPDKFFTVTVRAGYAIYDYGQTSQSSAVFEENPTNGIIVVPTTGGIRTADQSSYYAGMTLSHRITEKISYNLDFTQQIVPGVQSDASTVTSVALGGSWSITRVLSLQASMNYEHGQQGTGSIVGNVNETYDFVNASLSASYNFTKAITAALSYRRAMRYSNLDGGSYSQDLVGLNLTYRFL